MSEDSTVRGATTLTRRSVTLLLLLAVALVAASLVIGGRVAAGDDEPFGGTDAAVTESIEAGGHKPWFEPLLPPAGGEIESGLFALQAALGGVVLGWALGTVRERNRVRRTPGAREQE